MLLGLHLPRNGLQFLAVLLRLFVVLLDFVDLGGQILVLGRVVLIGDHELRKNQHVLDGTGPARQIFAQLDDFANYPRRAGERFAHRPFTALVALAQIHFAFAREEGNRAHFAQVHAHRVVGFIGAILGEFQVAEIVGVFVLFAANLGLFRNHAAGTVEIGEQVFKLAARSKVLG